MRIKSREDFLCGLLFILIGAIFALGAQTYHIGTASRMGSGYFPSLLAYALIFIGAVNVARSLVVPGEGVISPVVMPLLVILASICGFAFLLPPLGLLAATFLLVIASSAATGNPFARAPLLLALFLSIFSGGLFVGLLGLPISLWPQW